MWRFDRYTYILLNHVTNIDPDTHLILIRSTGYKPRASHPFETILKMYIRMRLYMKQTDDNV